MPRLRTGILNKDWWTRWWRIVAIIVVALGALLLSYPPQTKVVRVEEITEKHEFGQWVKGETKVVKRSLLAFLMPSHETETTVGPERITGYWVSAISVVVKLPAPPGGCSSLPAARESEPMGSKITDLPLAAVDSMR